MDRNKYYIKKSITHDTFIGNSFSLYIKVSILFFSLLLILSPPILSANTYNNIIPLNFVLNYDQFEVQTIDLLIFVSPTYQNDTELIEAIHSYQTMIKDDTNWSSKIIHLTTQQNDYINIDTIIESYFYDYHIKSCLIIGEDIDTPLSGIHQNMSKPSIIPWATIGGNTSYETCESLIVNKPYITDVFISFISPNPTYSYQIRKEKIIKTLHSFTHQKNHYSNTSITCFESSTINTHSKEQFHSLFSSQSFNYIEQSSTVQLQSSLKQQHKMFIVHGHSNPSKTLLNDDENVWFTIHHLKRIHTPVFIADGCYVNGKWLNDIGPHSQSSYANLLCENQNINVMILGLFSQVRSDNTQPIIQPAVHEILNGGTIAESFIGHEIDGSIVFHGDPTFCFQ